MKLSMITITVFLCILMVGCQESVQEGQDRHVINSQLIHSYNEMATQNALISEHTFYPYHFVENGAELSELGQRDLAILASHFVKHAGHLNIRQHNTPADLYEARVKLVRERLQEEGIDMERMSISDGMPGGSGMASERILVILREEGEGGMAETSATSRSGTR